VKKFSVELADFLRRHYPEANHDGWFRFSADIQIKDGAVDVEIPLLTQLPDASGLPSRAGKRKSP
jgi:hypothetical protein